MGKSGIANGKTYYLPREAFANFGKPDRLLGNWQLTCVKESAAGILPGIITGKAQID
jgi:hypothetical protein